MSDTATQAESAADLLRALRELHQAAKVEIRIEAKRLDHVDSPVASEADGNVWVYGFIAIAVALGWRAGIAWGIGALALGILVYLTLGKAYVHRRIERRFRERALSSLEIWRKLWRFPGITLTLAGVADGATCVSPDGNWMGFVREASAARPPATPD